MKNILKSVLFLFIISKTYAQSISVEPNTIKVGNILSIRTNVNTPNSLYLNSNNGIPPQIAFTENGLTFGTISKNSSNNLNFFANDGLLFETYNLSNFVSGLKLNKNGNVGIGTTEPSTKLKINGFTKLGSDAPAIKIKKLTGTTRSTQGAQVIINHGLIDSKILNISVMLDTEANDFIHPSYRSSTGYEFEWTSFNGSIYVKNVMDNSANILSKPIKILINYEE